MGKRIGLRKALDMMRLPGHRLMLMVDHQSPHGKSYYIVPGGYVDPEDAKKIIDRPDVRILDDGLLDSHPQSWCLADFK